MLKWNNYTEQEDIDMRELEDIDLGLDDDEDNIL